VVIYLFGERLRFPEKIPYGRPLKPEKVEVCTAMAMDGNSYQPGRGFVRVPVICHDNGNGRNDDKKTCRLRIKEDRELPDALTQIPRNIVSVIEVDTRQQSLAGQILLQNLVRRLPQERVARIVP
jgi:hypothetical protein